MRNTVAATVALAGVLFVASAASAGVLIPIVPVPNSTSTNVVGINDNNMITGFYKTSDGLTHGFVGTLAGSYSTFDYPTGGAEGIGINNDGYVVGLANASDGHIYGDAFERKPNGDIVPLTKGKKTIDGFPHAIVKNQKFIGEYWVEDKDEDLFVYGFYGKGTKYKSDLTLPFQTTRTRPRGYNDNGDVVGYFHDETVHDYPGFVLQDGEVTTVHYPDQSAYYVFLEGLNDKGQIVGDWQNQSGSVYHAFYYDLKKNAFNAINVPGSTVSAASAINKAGLVTISSDVGPFVYCPKAKACPDARGAIHISDVWIPASRGTGQWAICKNRCIGPSRQVVESKPVDRAKLREAIKRDPSLLAEFASRAQR